MNHNKFYKNTAMHISQKHQATATKSRPIKRAWAQSVGFLTATLLALVVLTQAGAMLRTFETEIPRGEANLSGFIALTGGRYEAIDGEGDFHSIATLISISPNSHYRLEFNIDRTARNRVTLNTDLFNIGYDEAEQDYSFPVGISTAGQRQNIIIYTGKSPDKAAVRIFYSGMAGLIVSNLHVKRIPEWTIKVEPILTAGLFILTAWLGWRFLQCTNKALTQSNPPTTAPEKSPNKTLPLIAIYLGIALLHYAFYIALPYWGGDEYVYKSIANGIWAFGKYGILTEAMVGQSVSFPNLLYPYLIAPTFFFGEHFYVFARLINALIMTSAIFPAYFVARELMGRRPALISATISVLIPFVNLGAYSVTEVLFFPLFLISFWLAFRCTEHPSILSHFLFGASVGLLLNVRLNAIILLPAFLIGHFWIGFYKNGPSTWIRRPYWLISIIGTLLSYLLLQYITHDRALSGLGFYAQVSDNKGIGHLIFTQLPVVAKLLGGHLATLALPYALPLGIMIATVLHAGKNEQASTKLHLFLILTVCFFVALVGLSVIFTINMTPLDIGGMRRWHSRYYFYAYPLIVMAGVIFSHRPDIAGRSRMVSWIVLAHVVSAGCYLFSLESADRWFGNTVDNADMSWYRVLPLWYWVGLCGTIGLTWLWNRRSAMLPRLALLYVIAWLSVSNYGWMVMAGINKRERPTPCGEWSLAFLNQNPGRFALASDSREKLVDTSFWIPYTAEMALIVGSKAPALHPADMAREADYLIANGSVAVGEEFRRVSVLGECRIYAFPGRR